jgi:hypothetical protein
MTYNVTGITYHITTLHITIYIKLYYMEVYMKKNNGIAIVLILIGVLILLGNMGMLEGELALFIISMGLFGGYILTGGRNRSGSIGFLIPACILLMIGIFTYLENSGNIKALEGSLFFFMLGTAFFIIYFINNYKRTDMTFGSKNWPVITGSSVYAFGTLVFLFESYEIPFVKILLQNLWPIGLILAGIIIIIKNFRR